MVAYRDRNLREIRMNTLCELLPGRNVDEIKKEWTNLKTIYTRELKREEGSRVSGTGTDSVYTSSWRYFKALGFLRGSDDVDPQTSTMEDAENMERPPKKSKSSKLKAAQEMEEMVKIEFYREALKCLQTPLPAAPLTPTPAVSGRDDEISSFLKNIEVTLRNFSRRDLTMAKKRINDVIFDMEMEVFHGEPTTVTPPTQPTPFQNVTNFGWPYNLDSQGSTSQTPYPV